MKRKLVVYGNHFNDIIYNIESFPNADTNNVIYDKIKKCGGLHNTIQWYKNKFDKTKIIKKSSVFNKAIAHIFLDNNSRTSFVEWNKNNLFDSKIPQCDWLHIMYLDTLLKIDIEKIQYFKKKAGYISADLCNTKFINKINRERLKQVTPYIDYLIISDNEWNEIKDFKTKNLIVHNKNGSWFRQELLNQIHYKKNRWKINTYKSNLIGAGDIYALGFILEKMGMENSINAMNMAHYYSTEYINEGL